MRIGQKLLSGFLLIILFVAVVGYLVMRQTHAALQKSIIEGSEALTAEIMDKIDRDVYAKIEIFREYSVDSILQAAVLKSNREFEQLDDIRGYVARADKQWTSAPRDEVTPFMQGIMDNRLAGELREKLEYYERSYGYRVFGEVFVTNKYGANVAQTGKTTDYRQDDEQWWQWAKKDGLYVRDVEYDESADVYSTDIGIRIDDEKGRFIGIMKVVMNVEGTINLTIGLKHHGLHEKHKTMHYKLTTRDGRIFYSSRDFKMFEEVSYLLVDIGSSEDKYVTHAIRGGYEPGEGLELSVQAHSRGYRDFKGLGWVLMVDHELAELFAPIAKMKRQVITLLSLMSTVAVVLSIIISRSIARPIERLKDAASRIGKGDLSPSIEVGSRDEVGQLAASFSAMAEDLKKTTVSRDLLVESEERFRAICASAQDAILMMDNDGRIFFFNEAAQKMFGYAREEALGRELHTLLGAERFYGAYRTGFARFRETGQGAVVGKTLEVAAVKKDGSEIPIEVSVSAVWLKNEWNAIGIVRDISERKAAEEKTNSHLRQLAALRDIDIAITGSFDLHVTLDVIFKQVQNWLSSDAADILLYRPHLQIFEYTAGYGFKTQALRYTRLKLGESHAGQAALEKRVIHIPDLMGEGGGFKRSRHFDEEGFISYYGVPLIAKGNVLGVLEVFSRTGIRPGREWLDFLEALAGQAAIAIDNATLFDNLQRANIDLVMAYDETIEGWSKALDLRDKETEGHSRRVTELTLRIASAMRVSEAEQAHIRRGALLHDIGKMGIPDRILLKPGPLDDGEWEIMRRHPVLGREMLSSIDFLRPALDIPSCHHEKWDGTGYPQGLKGERIPLAARIFALVDIYDALRSDRPYRPAWPKEKVLGHIRSLSGTHLDPKVVEMFFEMDKEGLT